LEGFDIARLDLNIFLKSYDLNWTKLRLM